MRFPRTLSGNSWRGSFQRNHLDLTGITECYGHGLRAILAKPEILNWMALAANGSCHLLVGGTVPCQRTLSDSFGKVHAEEAALAHAVKGRGTSWVETLRQHRNLANAATVAARLQKQVENRSGCLL